MTTEPTEPTEAELNKQVTMMVDQAGHLLVKDAESLGVANQYLVDLSKMKKVVVQHYKPMKEAANKAHKAITSQEKADLEPIDEADKVVRGMTGAYVLKERQAAEKEQKRLDKLAEDKAERERKKLEEKAEAEKDPEKKAELEEEAESVYVEPKIATPTVEKTSRVSGGGITYRDDIEVEVINIKDVCAAVIAGHLPESVIDFKVSKIKAYVKMMGIKEGTVKGIRIKEVQKQSVRGG